MNNDNPFIVNNALAVTGEAEISGSATITGSLEVLGSHAKAMQVRVAGGTIAYIDSSMVTDLSGTTQLVDSFDPYLGNSARWTVSISGNETYKTTEIISIWGRVSGSWQINSAEYTTNSIGGDDIPVSLNVHIQSNLVKLVANTPTSSIWNIKTLRFML